MMFWQFTQRMASGTATRRAAGISPPQSAQTRLPG
ncbi:C4-type zinc finger domain protein, partial [Escherichia coli FRIK1997]